MKKSFCVALMLAVMVFAFAGCGGAPTPEKLDRWTPGETKTYTISLLTKDSGFEAGEWYDYPKQAGVQIKPTGIGEGSFLTYQIDKNAQGQWIFDTKMVVKQIYPTTDLASGWESTVPSSITYTKNGNTVEFVSKMESNVVFNTVYNNGQPVSSTKKVQSVVVFNNQNLKPELAFNDFVSTATYKDHKATTHFVDNTNTVTNKEDKTVDIGNGLVFDNEAMLLAIRSIDFDVLKEAQQTTLDFFNSVEQSMQTITVAFGTDDYKFVDSETAPKHFRIGATPKGLGNPYFFYFEQAKQTASPGTAIGKSIPKYELVQMNQGYMHFE